MIIYDDCSTDSTPFIINKFIKEFPNQVTYLRPEENQFSKGIKTYPITHKKCKGKYIAHCDGDDYWIDNRKLQKQVDLLEENNSFIACVTNGTVKYENEDLKSRILFDEISKKYFDIDDLMNGNPFLQCTVMYRADFIKNNSYKIKRLNVGDYALYVLAAQNGKIGYVDSNTAIYRVHSSGDWQGQNSIDALLRSIKIAKEIREIILKDLWHKWQFCKYIGRLYGKLGSHYLKIEKKQIGFQMTLISFLHPLPSFNYRYKIFKQLISGVIFHSR